jgi:hypothetical protein
MAARVDQRSSVLQRKVVLVSMDRSISYYDINRGAYDLTGRRFSCYGRPLWASLVARTRIVIHCKEVIAVTTDASSSEAASLTSNRQDLQASRPAVQATTSTHKSVLISRHSA